MADAIDATTAAIDRRGFIGRCAMTSLAGIAGSGLSGVALAAPTMRSYTGRYAIDSHRIIDGHFVWPGHLDKADVVLVVSETGTPNAAAHAIARRHAACGRVAIVPDLPATYRAATLGGKAAMIAALTADLPRFRRMARSTGRVSLVAA